MAKTAATAALSGAGCPWVGKRRPRVAFPIRRFGDWVLDLKPPGGSPVTRLDLQPRVLFPALAA